jgi:hypothetical protein
LDFILLIGVIFTYKTSKRKTMFAAATLMVALVYIGSMIELHNMASRQFQIYTKNIAGVQRFAVGPQFLDPFHWTGWIETPTEVSSFRIDEWTGEVRQEQRLAKAAETKITATAEATHAGAVFLSFARFPVTRVEKTPSGYRVLLIDFRFFRASPHTALAAEIILNNDFSVVSESTSFLQQLDYATGM